MAKKRTLDKRHHARMKTNAFKDAAGQLPLFSVGRNIEFTPNFAQTLSDQGMMCLDRYNQDSRKAPVLSKDKSLDYQRAVAESGSTADIFDIFATVSALPTQYSGHICGIRVCESTGFDFEGTSYSRLAPDSTMSLVQLILSGDADSGVRNDEIKIMESAGVNLQLVNDVHANVFRTPVEEYAFEYAGKLGDLGVMGQAIMLGRESMKVAR